MTSLVVLFSYQITLNISKNEAATEIPSKKLCYDFNRSSQCNQRLWEKISLTNTLSARNLNTVVPDVLHIFYSVIFPSKIFFVFLKMIGRWNGSILHSDER